jgi:hypothetical protein
LPFGGGYKIDTNEVEAKGQQMSLLNQGQNDSHFRKDSPMPRGRELSNIDDQELPMWFATWLGLDVVKSWSDDDHCMLCRSK